jgi:hypothetical protein
LSLQLTGCVVRDKTKKKMNKRQKTITTNDQVLIDEKSLFLWIYTGYRKKKKKTAGLSKKREYTRMRNKKKNI